MKIYKRALILLFISLFFILGLKAQGNSSNDVEILVKAFKTSNANVESFWIHVGTSYGTYENDKQLLTLGNQLSEQFILPTVKNLSSNGSQKMYYTTGTWGNGTSVELNIKRINTQSNELYVIFRLKGNHDLENFVTYYNILNNKLQNIQLSPKINSCIQGNINGKLSNVEQYALMNGILEELDANQVESLDTNLVKSISAYSTKIRQNIWTSNQKMNIQIATHVNQLNQKTVLTMGTPIITIEY